MQIHLVGDQKRRNHMGDLDVDGEINEKITLNKMALCSAFMLLRVKASGNIC